MRPSYEAPENPSARLENRAPLNTDPRVLSSLLPRPARQAPHHKGPISSRRMNTPRLTWALSTSPKPTIMVSIEVPP